MFDECNIILCIRCIRKGAKMVDWNIVQNLMNCFPRSVINQNGEFIAHTKANSYFILRNCETEFDIKCKVLEWFSRDAYKTEPFGTKRANDDFHEFMRTGINRFLQTYFTSEDMQVIYTYLGNACNHQKTIRFVESGFDLATLQEVE